MSTNSFDREIELTDPESIKKLLDIMEDNKIMEPKMGKQIKRVFLSSQEAEEILKKLGTAYNKASSEEYTSDYDCGSSDIYEVIELFKRKYGIYNKEE